MSVWLSRCLVSIPLRRIKVGGLVVVEGDKRRVYGSGPPAAIVKIASTQTWVKLLRGSRGMAEAFAQGLWDSPDLVALIRLAARNATGIDRLRAAQRRCAGRCSGSRRFGAGAQNAAAVATSPPITTSATSFSPGCSIRL